MQVYLTVDVELWPDNWQGHRSQFQRSYQRYILGKTANGCYGLPHQLELLKRYDLKAVFFVESLFACEFGIDPLREIVEMIQQSGQQIQLHAHPEWVAHMEEPFVKPAGRYTLAQFDSVEQIELIRVAKSNLHEAGASDICAFRSGSFSVNRATIEALKANGLFIDSSVNISILNHLSEFGQLLAPTDIAGVLELPLTVYQDWPGHLRHLQVSASSFGEFKQILHNACTEGRANVVMLSHSAELLTANRTRVDTIAVNRFSKMCKHLADNRDKYSTEHFVPSMRAAASQQSDSHLNSRWYETANRMGQQALRRVMF